MQENRSQISAEYHAALAGPFVRRERGRGMLLMRGKDARDLLHRLSTARIDTIAAGEVRETLLTTEKGRIIDALLVADTGEGLRLLTSDGRADTVRAWLEKYTIMEDCTYEDQGADTAQFSIHNIPAGEESVISGIVPPAEGSWVTADIGGIAVEVLRHNSVTGSGLRLVCPAADADAFERRLIDDTALPLVGDEAFTLWRINGLLPAVGRELGEHTNPLESGAERAVDFRKGCFIGQEVIARLDSYDKVQRHPRRLRFIDAGGATPETGAPLTSDGADAGFVTTVAFDPERGELLGIGLVRTAFEAAGTRLDCGGIAVDVLA